MFLVVGEGDLLGRFAFMRVHIVAYGDMLGRTMVMYAHFDIRLFVHSGTLQVSVCVLLVCLVILPVYIVCYGEIFDCIIILTIRFADVGSLFFSHLLPSNIKY